jgi:glycosyltransferase involved in cell wall biosynthesis
MKVFNIVTGLDDGGAEGVLYRLCIHDRSARHIVISLMDEGKYGPLLREVGVEVHCLNMRRGRPSIGALWRLSRLLRSHRPDLVQTWMYHADLLGGLVARMSGSFPVVWGIRHTTLVPGHSARSTIVVARLCARLSRLIPARIICCAEESARVHAALGYDSGRMVVVANGYDFGTFRHLEQARVALRSEWAVDDDTPLIGMVGRFDPQKDHRNLLRACELLRARGFRFRLVLVGSGLTDANEALGEWVALHGLRDSVCLLGQRTDIPAVMSAIDLHVLPSLYGEAFPNVVAEAMACGTPCVVTDVGDASAIVGDTGWTVPPGDPQALANVIADVFRLRTDADKWAARRCAARSRAVANFGIEAMIARYKAVWNEVVASQ